jgi:chromate transporter
MQPTNPQRETSQVAESIETVSMVGLLAIFLKIGSIGFGGGIATIALMEEDFVRRCRLIPLHEFVHGVGLGQLLGGFAVNVAVFIGYRLFGIMGALLSATAFIAPSFLLTLFLSNLYFRYHAIPALQGVMAGLSPVVMALILNAAWSIGRRVLYSWPTVLIALAALVAGISQLNAALVLVAAGAAGFLLPLRTNPTKQSGNTPKTVRDAVVQSLWIASSLSTPLSTILTTFFKIGLVFFGGGFVLVPVLHDRLVTHLGWLKPHEFLDGLAISNLTPGSIALVVAFAGYHLAGISGALAATVALFAPGVLLILAISHQYNRFLGDQRAQRFLEGVNPAVAGLILSAAFLLGRNTFVSWHGYVLLACSFVLLAGLRWHPAFVLALGAAMGYLRLLP